MDARGRRRSTPWRRTPQPFSPFKHVEVGSRLRKKDGTKETLMGKGTKGWWKILWDGDEQTVNTTVGGRASPGAPSRAARAPARRVRAARGRLAGAAIAASDEEQPALRHAAETRRGPLEGRLALFGHGPVRGALGDVRRGPTYAVKYDDGDVESHVPEALVRRARGASRRRRTSRSSPARSAWRTSATRRRSSAATTCAACLRQYAASRWFEVKATSGEPAEATIWAPSAAK
ncbi:hypothetical protein JL720_15481 [Aureococcus anophagefferens]|nr:hypothetical protein JL720_15481 [Aureococcus anophagefferens]